MAPLSFSALAHRSTSSSFVATVVHRLGDDGVDRNEWSGDRLFRRRPENSNRCRERERLVSFRSSASLASGGKHNPLHTRERAGVNDEPFGSQFDLLEHVGELVAQESR